jgi:hypothetical protein
MGAYYTKESAIAAWNTRADDATCKAKQAVDKQADSREKLEADVRNQTTCSWVTAPLWKVIDWLDRQEAITSKEWCYSHDALEEELERIRAERDELQELREKQAATIKDLTAERNIYRWELGELENNMAREIAELLDENDVIEVFNELGKRRLVT